MSDLIANYNNALRAAIEHRELTRHGTYAEGKFEGQTPLTAAPHQTFLEGGADDETGSTAYGDQRRAGFCLFNQEMAQLKTKRYCVITTDRHGSVTLEQCDTEAEYQRLLGRAPDMPQPGNDYRAQLQIGTHGAQC